MSEQHTETQVVEESESSEKKSSLSGLAEDEYIGMITKLRQEAADKRVGKRDAEKKLEEDAKKWQEHIDSQKSEFERLAEEKASLATKLQTMEKQFLRQKIANEFKLDEDLAEFVDGADEDTMRKQAQKLAEKMKKPLELMAGDRGGPVVPNRSEGGDFLEMLGNNL